MATSNEISSECNDSTLIKLNGSNNIAEDDDYDKKYFYNTKELNLSNYKLLNSPKFHNQLNDLVTLDLSNNNICDLPESICLLKKLEYLIIDDNNIQRISIDLNELEKLKELSISNNGLTELPLNMEKLQKLEILNLSNNKLQSLPNSWAKMNNLLTLDISMNLFIQIPNCLREGMSKLAFLNVSKNRNMNINGVIYSNNLKKFYAKNNGDVDSSFPKWIFSGKFSEIDELNFENTRFRTIKIPINNRKIQLKKLNLQQCKLYDTVIENLLINISSLEHLNIGNKDFMSTGNSFPVLPNSYVLNPEALKTINIAATGLADISKSIEAFTNLTEINIQQNYLSWLPEEICNLKKLQILIISNNNLIMLPKNLGSMISLKILDAANNHLSSLPSSISNLQNLEFMDLYQNYLTEIPKEIENLKNLKALDLELNHFDTDDIVLPISYSNLLYQSRIDKLDRGKGPVINENNSDSITSPSNLSSDTWSSAESIQEELHYNNHAILTEENWENPEDFADDFDPFNPPPIPPPKWETPCVFYENQFNFCPADLHPPRIKDVIAEARANGQLSPPLPIIEGQFDDAD
ncbi:hypothetical protein PV327_001647 [Microctonus hyperodae]|uniref:L domain-like protein n=1 Tax=Microctonus hyperodae TaxID=165561 RepID=A0AA39KN89_MICHY|nr:hypothetical protein PV327_001647 [Microctonus hyperodae]